MEFRDIKGIAVYGTDCIVDISRGDDDVCRFVSAKEKYFNVQNDKGQLTVTQKKNNIFYRIIMRRFEFKLILPKFFRGRLRFRNKNGGLYINDGAFTDVELSTRNGKFEVQNIVCGEFTLKVRNGSVHLRSVAASDAVNIKCTNGEVKAESIKAATVSASCHNASITAIDVKANRLDCSTGNGAIDVSAADVNDLRLDTSNGKINALCIGARDDYRLTLGTSHGTINVDGVPQKNIADVAGTAKRRVTADNSNGDIDIKFV